MKGGIVMKILLAEDHDNLREIIEDYLFMGMLWKVLIMEKMLTIAF